MIINVGGRTDIVNYYTPWLINRLKEGYVYTRNPYNPRQITRYDLSRKYVDAIIFCSKNYKPILEYMPKIQDKYPLYCHYTITCYEDDVEAKVPRIDESIETLTKLSSIVTPEKLSWRYDPILLTNKYTIDKHLEQFEYITRRIHDKINTCIFSFVDMYNKVYRNMPEIIELTEDDRDELLRGLSRIAHKYDMTLQSCAVSNKYNKYDIQDSGCITTSILEKSNKLCFKDIKHKGSRKGCKCITWRDIGEYDTCPNQCKYCYANRRPDIAYRKYRKHDPTSPILIGHITEKDKINNAKQYTFLKHDEKQLTLI